jgi:sugar O-acyltransferase (sialic acid O-acetyltransferase NeuD family)
MYRQVYIVGAGGFAREVCDICNSLNSTILGFLIDPEYKKEEYIDNIPVIDDIFDIPDGASILIAVGNPRDRQELYNRIFPLGKKFNWEIAIHPSVTIGKHRSIGVGTIIAAGARITNNVHIGRYVHINLNCTVGHDVIVNDFCTLSPGVHISGNVKIGTGVFFGSGAVVAEKINIGSNAIIGAGAVVLDDVPPDVRAYGVPAKLMRR